MSERLAWVMGCGDFRNMNTIKIMNKKSNKFISAFTLIELMVVMIIVVTLMALTYTVILSAKAKHKNMQAKSDIKGLELALKSYRSTYGFWPMQAGSTSDTSYITNNGVIISVLIGSGGITNQHNPRGIRFFEIIDSAWTNNMYLDPWGKPYFIAFDNDNDNSITVTNDTFHFNYAGSGEEEYKMWILACPYPVAIVALNGENFPRKILNIMSLKWTESDDTTEYYASWKR